MINLRFLLGLYPKTEILELKEHALIKELSDLEAFKSSPELDQFLELRKQVLSPEFKATEQRIKSIAYKGSDAYQKETQYKALKKSARIKNYYSVVASPLYKNYCEVKDSEALKQLETEPESDHSELLKQQSFKDYTKFKNSKAFILFDDVSKTTEISDFEELEAYIKTEAFTSEKAYLSLKPNTRWAQTEEFAQFAEYKKLSNSERIKWYFRIVNSNKFDDLKKWETTFSDDFNGTQLDTNTWLTRYYWGDTALNDNYSLSDDLHLTTDGANIKLSNSILTIETRKEKAEGNSWHPQYGFMPRAFEYTSGLINTGKSFRQQHGKFKAKIKMNGAGNVTSAFWMVGSQIMPHVDVAKFSNRSYFINSFWRNEVSGATERVSDKLMAGKLGSGFFIYELEWTPQSLIWKINDMVIKTEVRGVPSEPMYLQFSSSVFDNRSSAQDVSALQIDWVKCYATHE